MTRQSFCLVLAIGIAPLLSSCSGGTLPGTAPGIVPATSPVARTVEPAKPKLTGAWNGSWSGGGASGKFSMHLTQKGKKFSGSVAIVVKKTTVKATIKGTIAGKGKISLVVSITKLGSGKGTATVNKARTTMQGSLTFTKFGTVSFSASKA